MSPPQISSTSEQEKNNRDQWGGIISTEAEYANQGSVTSGFSQSVLNEILSQIRSDSIKKHITVLGSDSLEGRATGWAGGDKAAHYLATQLQKLNMLPAGDRGGYYQSIPMHGTITLAESQLRLYGTDGSIHDFELFQDYLLFKGGSQTYVPSPVPLVFVGFGITAPEYDYNDYQSIDVSGKVAVYLEGEPLSDDPTYFAGENPTIYSLPESKQRMALARGALGSFLIADSPHDWQKLRREFSFEEVTLAYNVTGQLSVIFHPQSAGKLFENAPYPLQEVRELAANHSLHSFNMNQNISFTGEFIERDFMASNVIGMIPGRDEQLKESYVIVSAHYDHLGYGPPLKGDSIYNGVVDNALGVAAALEIARLFSGRPDAPGRSVIFLFTTGEEKGLLGATYYTDHPVFPLYKTVANINIDGLAMLDTFDEVIGVGAELSTLLKFLSEAAREMGIALSDYPGEGQMTRIYSRSDQQAFARAGIPSLLIQEGLRFRNTPPQQALHRLQEWMETIYHSPFDDLDQPLCWEGILQHAQLITSVIFKLTSQPETPSWNPGVKYQNIRLQTNAEKR